MQICSLCRKENTEEHQQSGYHKFNQQLFADGKMPISEQSYNDFESGRGGSNSNNKTEVVSHNVKGWHWSTITLMPWFTSTLKNKITTTCNIPHPQNKDKCIKIRLKSVSGDAQLQNRKNRAFASFLVDLKFDARCVLDTPTHIQSSFNISDCSSDDVDDIAVSGLKFESGTTDALNAEVSKIIKNQGLKLITSAVNAVLKEMQVFVKNVPEHIPDVAELPFDFDTPVIEPIPPVSTPSEAENNEDDKKEEKNTSQ